MWKQTRERWENIKKALDAALPICREIEHGGGRDGGGEADLSFGLHGTRQGRLRVRQRGRLLGGEPNGERLCGV